MGRKKIIDSGSVSKINLEDYEIIECKNPFPPKLICLYQGKLEDQIEAFEAKYGKIDGKIYYDASGSLVGFTGTNVIPHSERMLQNNETNVS